MSYIGIDIGSLEDISKVWAKPARTFEPQPANAAKYNERYEIYSEIYNTLKPLGEKINRI